jgi:chromosome segregation ATPase
MSDPRNQAVVAAPEAERIFELNRRPSLIEASLSSAQSISHTMTGVIQPQIDTHSAAIATAQGQIGTQGAAIASAKTLLDAHSAAITKAEGQIGAHSDALASAKTQLDAHSAAIASTNGQLTKHGEAIAIAKTRLDTQNETLTGMQSHLATLGETATRHDQTIVSALLGDEGHIRRIGLELVALAERVWRLEHPHEAGRASSGAGETRGTRGADEALRERVTAMEEAIRQLLARGPQGSGPRPRGRS